MLNKRLQLLLITNIILGAEIIGLNAEASNMKFPSEISIEVKAPREAFNTLLDITKEEQAKREEERRIAEEKRLEEERRRQEEEERKRLEALKKPHFNPYNVGEVSNLSREQMYKMLEGTALQTLANAYYYYEEVYQVNAVFMMALTAEESGWGRSELAMFRNNLSGHKDPYTSDWKYYSDWGQCLEESFRLIREEYLNEDGAFYTGSNIYNINLTYCPDPVTPNSWANNIVSITKLLFRKLEE